MEVWVGIGVWFWCGFICYGFYKGQRKAYYAAGVYERYDENDQPIRPPRRILYSKKEETFCRILFLFGFISLIFLLSQRVLGFMFIGLAHDEATVAELTSLKFCFRMPKEFVEGRR